MVSLAGGIPTLQGGVVAFRALVALAFFLLSRLLLIFFLFREFLHRFHAVKRVASRAPLLVAAFVSLPLCVCVYLCTSRAVVRKRLL